MSLLFSGNMRSWGGINHSLMLTAILQAAVVCFSLPFVFPGNDAVPRAAAGHSLLCVDPLHQPLPSPRSAAVWLWRRRESEIERGGSHSSVQVQSVMGLSPSLPRDTECGFEVCVDHVNTLFCVLQTLTWVWKFSVSCKNIYFAPLVVFISIVAHFILCHLTGLLV